MQSVLLKQPCGFKYQTDKKINTLKYWKKSKETGTYIISLGFNAVVLHILSLLKAINFRIYNNSVTADDVQNIQMCF